MGVLVGRRGRSQSDHKCGQKQSHVSPKWLTGREAGSPWTLNLPACWPWMPGLQVCWEIHVCCPGHLLCSLLERSEQTTTQVECGFLASSPAGTSAEAYISPLFTHTSPTEILKNTQLLVSQLHKVSVFFFMPNFPATPVLLVFPRHHLHFSLPQNFFPTSRAIIP